MTSDFVLTYGERLEVYRRRVGFTLHDAARWYGRTVYPYRVLEQQAEQPEGAPAAPDVEPTVLEIYRLRRRRAGLTMADMGRMLGVTRQWVSDLENGRQDPHRLAAFWDRDEDLVERDIALQKHRKSRRKPAAVR